MTTGQTAGSEETEINEDSGSDRVVSGTFLLITRFRYKAILDEEK